MGKKLIIRGADWIWNALNFETIGKLFDSLEGLGETSIAYTYVYKQPVPAGRLSFYLQASGAAEVPFHFKVFSKAGSTLTQVSDNLVTVKTNQWNDLGIDVTEGQYIGIYRGDTTKVKYKTEEVPGLPHFSAASGDASTVDYTTDFNTHFAFVFGIKIP